MKPFQLSQHIRRSWVNLLDYGSNVAACKAAVAELVARGGGTLLIPRGSYSWASADLSVASGGGAIMLPDNVTVEGDGAIISIVGDTLINAVFHVLNKSNVTVRDLLCIGNGKGHIDASLGSFFYYRLEAGAAGTENIRLEDVRLENFGGQRWIHILNVSANAMRGVRLADISGISRAGNNVAPGNIAAHASVLMVYGGGTGPIVDVEIPGFYAEAAHIKNGITIFGRVQQAHIADPAVYYAGQTGTPDDCGAYGINCYSEPGEQTDITISNPVIYAPRSCGIYLRGCTRVLIDNPQIYGQTDTIITSLSKGAIATSGAFNVTVRGGVLSGNVYDVMVTPQGPSAELNFVLDGVTMVGASNAAVTFNPGAGTGAPDRLALINCDIQSNAYGVRIFNNKGGSGRHLANFEVKGGRIVANTNIALEFNAYGGSVLSGYKIDGATIKAGDIAISADTTATGDLSITNCVIEAIGTMSYGLLARAFPKLTLDNVEFRNQGSGYATLTDGAGGTIRNVRAYNVTNGFSPNSLGMVVPTLPGWVNARVENLNPIALGGVGVMFTIDSWVWSAGAWLQQRTPTGL